MKKPSWLEKENLYNIIFEADTPAGKMFDIVLIIAISLSLIVSFIESVPTMARTFKTILEVLEYILTGFFTIEYIARLYCSPRPRDYALSFFGVIDLLATLPPYLSFFFPSARYMILLRSFRFIRVFRIFKLFSFLNEFTDIGTSVYWAIVTMTTVGYGDITPVTPLGRILSAFIMLLGYTIIAVPTGIVSATFIDETNKKVEKGLCPRCGGKVRSKDRFCSHCGEKL